MCVGWGGGGGGGERDGIGTRGIRLQTNPKAKRKICLVSGYMSKIFRVGRKANFFL